MNRKPNSFGKIGSRRYENLYYRHHQKNVSQAQKQMSSKTKVSKKQEGNLLLYFFHLL